MTAIRNFPRAGLAMWALLAAIATQPAAASSGVAPQLIASAGTSKTVATEVQNPADEQFKRLVSQWKAETPRVPSLAAIYDREITKAGKPSADRFARLGSFGTDLDALQSPVFAGSSRPGGSKPSRAPVSANRLTSGFGPRIHPILGGLRVHSGVDLAAATGTPIRATADGVVSRAGWTGGYGLLVAIRHSNGMVTRYGHMSRVAVAPGTVVRKSDVIGFVGSTGRSTGPHLHYEVLVNGRAVNPMSYMR